MGTSLAHPGRGKSVGQRIKDGLAVRARVIGDSLTLMALKQFEGEKSRDADEVWNDDYATAAHAHSALITTESYDDALITAVFKEGQLDRRNPWHWRALMTIFVEAYYPGKALNTFWSSDRLSRLLFWEMEAKALNPKATPAQIISDLKKRIRLEMGKDLDKSSVEDRMKKANNPKINTKLAQEIAQVKIVYEQLIGLHKKDGKSLPTVGTKTLKGMAKTKMFGDYQRAKRQVSQYFRQREKTR